MAKQLRAIGPDDAPEDAEIVSVFDAGERGSRIDELVQLRRILARAIDDTQTPAKELSPLSRRYSEVSNEIHALRKRESEEAEENAVTPDDEFSASAI